MQARRPHALPLSYLHTPHMRQREDFPLAHMAHNRAPFYCIRIKFAPLLTAELSMYLPARSSHAGSQLGATGQLVLGCLALLLASCGRYGTTNPDDRRIFERMLERHRALAETVQAQKKRWSDSGLSTYQYTYQRTQKHVR